MSHVGRNPIKLPENVSINIMSLNKGTQTILVKGKYGILKLNFTNEFFFVQETNKIYIKCKTGSQKVHTTWGTLRTHLANIIKGVSQGYLVKLILVGIEYKASIENNNLILKLGYSHDITYPIPDDVQITCLKPTLISIFGINKERVFQVAAEIRTLKKPEPYKGKGIRYENEIVLQKEGKKK